MLLFLLWMTYGFGVFSIANSLSLPHILHLEEIRRSFECSRSSPEHLGVRVEPPFSYLQSSNSLSIDMDAWCVLYGFLQSYCFAAIGYHPPSALEGSASGHSYLSSDLYVICNQLPHLGDKISHLVFSEQTLCQITQ
ncbi:hypothetical protein AVEN_151613-1 [Araneus ventricosus]|uniref:Uncharacterized protein n=1 Tax=Araneus ventricosus TaxID=182803 RepID=A0A4Y2UD30_ARAVE|nr:hypothetical protein AVEN_151613-1 [Araneus ventricosus]